MPSSSRPNSLAVMQPGRDARATNGSESAGTQFPQAALPEGPESCRSCNQPLKNLIPSATGRRSSDWPTSLLDARRWRQLDDELERRSKTSLDALQTHIATLSAELQRTTALLVEKKAWAAR